MHEALDSYVIKGLSHNLCFLKELVRHPRFVKGDTSTKFIPQEFPEGFHGVKVRPCVRSSVCSWSGRVWSGLLGD